MPARQLKMARLCAGLLLASSPALAQDFFLASQGLAGSAARASPSDLRRARAASPPPALLGKSGGEIAEGINLRLRECGLKLRSCNLLTHEDLDGLARSLWPLLSEEIRLEHEGLGGRSRRFSTVEAYERHWAAEVGAFVLASEQALLREARCAELLMLWAHHVPEAGRPRLQALPWPALPAYDAARAAGVSGAVAATYAESFGCSIGHNMTATSTSDHRWPHWPEEFHYHARAHGGYPFWLGSAPSNETAEMEAWYSERQRAETLYHSSCASEQLGQGVPCYHVMLGPMPSPKAYVYRADLSYCCVSEPVPGSMHFTKILTTMPSDFIDRFTYQGEEDFSGDFYKGRVKRYSLMMGLEPFWFLTSPNGLPVQQGESTGIFHDYNQSSFDTSAIDPSVFAIPQVCKDIESGGDVSPEYMCNFL